MTGHPSLVEALIRIQPCKCGVQTRPLRVVPPCYSKRLRELVTPGMIQGVVNRECCGPARKTVWAAAGDPELIQKRGSRFRVAGILLSASAW